ncbi:hypothetical protein PC116_g10556 [Phytophthora cactorum]|uniref:Retroviral polymerase SH3-like domain-containing protein n=2 Tax=Phytophthora cactorum TaxID=29920 RepID=A0A8T0YZD3_9STRA|nr:hypothetical protein PC111_g19289 [Phytophthora cactorum]KAG2817643.1 hypothetical protein PC112_g12973 [Phytophthora cactorum]KAG2855183.1 hypothetical protein PC113_g12649 [Phytophthora cactorum]KAG2930729.1 hypothetical protein PC117_g13659 [Phytophthora cactorum]KAG2960597.1 hypothetical protein PC118_g22425 [Phytophthora cactorum]
MLHHAKLDKCVWAETALTAIYMKNRLPSPKIEHKTPFEIVYKSKPSVKHMRVFGCRTYILTPKEKQLKWDPKSRAGIFLGYEEVYKAYRLYGIEAGQVVISRDVNFDESTFELSPPIPMKMSTTWTSTRLTSTMMVRARRSTSRQGSARVVRVTKMKLPEDRERCVSDLDWKKQVRRTTPLCTEQTQTKKNVSPVGMSTRLSPSDTAIKVNAPFREAVGALMYLMTATRPDIAYAVGNGSRFMENPQEEHWVAVKRIFRYLQGTKTHGICFEPGDNIDFRRYSDADWAGHLADRKSTSGYTFMLMVRQ